jgi:hypothetical protein
MVVLDLGDDVSSVWSAETGTLSLPSSVALDTDEPLPQHKHAARSFLASMLEGSGIGAIEGRPVLLPVRLSPVDATHSIWCEVVEEIGGDPLLIHRPLAAGVALDIESDGHSTHLMAEVSEATVDLAVVGSGSVVCARRIPRHDVKGLHRVTDECLRALDPDDELEIRDIGAHLYGWAATRHAAETMAAIDLPLADPVGVGPTVLEGARTMAAEMLPWLVADLR